MKTILTIISLTLTTAGYGQDSDVSLPDSLETIKLEYKTLDSTAIKAKAPLINIHFRNIVTYHSEDGVMLAYCTTDRN